MTTYLTLSDFKAIHGITDSARDTVITNVLTQASESVETYCGGRKFTLDSVVSPRIFSPLNRAVWDEDGDHLPVPDIGAATGLVVETGRPGAWTDITAAIDCSPMDAISIGKPITELIYVLTCYPRQAQRVQVTAKWGWPSVPNVIVLATQLQANRLFRRKDTPEGVVGSADWGAIRVGRIDPDVASLLTPYVLPGMA